MNSANWEFLGSVGTAGASIFSSARECKCLVSIPWPRFSKVSGTSFPLKRRLTGRFPRFTNVAYFKGDLPRLDSDGQLRSDDEDLLVSACPQYR